MIEERIELAKDIVALLEQLVDFSVTDDDRDINVRDVPRFYAEETNAKMQLMVKRLSDMCGGDASLKFGYLSVAKNLSEEGYEKTDEYIRHVHELEYIESAMNLDRMMKNVAANVFGENRRSD